MYLHISHRDSSRYAMPPASAKRLLRPFTALLNPISHRVDSSVDLEYPTKFKSSVTLPNSKLCWSTSVCLVTSAASRTPAEHGPLPNIYVRTHTLRTSVALRTPDELFLVPKQGDLKVTSDRASHLPFRSGPLFRSTHPLDTLDWSPRDIEGLSTERDICTYEYTLHNRDTDSLIHCGLFVYEESIKRELKIRPGYDCRCDERLKTKVEDSTHLTYTGLKKLYD